MVIPEFIENVFKWLPVNCQDKQWCKEWKTREQEKDEKQRELDADFYAACWKLDWNEAKRFSNLGATNDYVDEDQGITAFILLYSFEKKEMNNGPIFQLMQESERSTKVLSAVQNHFSKKIRTKLAQSCGSERWMGNWKGAQLTKDFHQLAKDAALWITCQNQEWELAAKWIDRGATNHFVDDNGTTALHYAAQEGSSQIVETILDRFGEESERKDQNFESPLCIAFQSRRYDIADIILKKKCKYPIIQLMLSGRYTDDFEEGLLVINKWTDLKIQFKTDFEFNKTAKVIDKDEIYEIIATLIEGFVTKYKTSEAKVDSFNCKICFHSVSQDQFSETIF